MRILSRFTICVMLSGCLLAASFVHGREPAKHSADPVTLENLVSPQPNRKDEPLAERFSLSQAAHFLDSAALDWQKQRNCMTCHTNYAFLMARPAISADAPAHSEVRRYAERLVSERWPEKGPRWDAEVVATATVLAFNDAATTGKLHPITRQALDKMWTVQRADGGWTWLKCDWPPMESDDEFGAAFAAIGVGVAPEGYADTPAAKAGMAKLREYLKKNPPPTLHHRAMLLWAASYTPDLITGDDRKRCLYDLLSLQRPDGGWALASLGDWKRGDGSPQDVDDQRRLRDRLCDLRAASRGPGRGQIRRFSRASSGSSRTSAQAAAGSPVRCTPTASTTSATRARPSRC